MSDRQRYTRESYQHRVEDLASFLRDLAERVERESTVIQNHHTNDTLQDGFFVESAVRVIHAVNWGLANAEIDSVVRFAARADDALREGQQSEALEERIREALDTSPVDEIVTKASTEQLLIHLKERLS